MAHLGYVEKAGRATTQVAPCCVGGKSLVNTSPDAVVTCMRPRDFGFACPGRSDRLVKDRRARFVSAFIVFGDMTLGKVRHGLAKGTPSSVLLPDPREDDADSVAPLDSGT